MLAFPNFGSKEAPKGPKIDFLTGKKIFLVPSFSSSDLSERLSVLTASSGPFVWQKNEDFADVFGMFGCRLGERLAVQSAIVVFSFLGV